MPFACGKYLDAAGLFFFGNVDYQPQWFGMFKGFNTGNYLTKTLFRRAQTLQIMTWNVQQVKFLSEREFGRNKTTCPINQYKDELSSLLDNVHV